MKRSEYNGISAYFITHPVSANLLMLVILAAGLLTGMGLRKEIISAIEPNNITISMEYDSGTAHQAEEGIAIKIEEAVKGLDGIKKISSTSTGSSALVVITKTGNQKLDPLFNEVKNKVDAIANFPSKAKKPVITKAKYEDHAIWVQIYGDADFETLQRLGLALKNDLLKKNGISKVNLYGDRYPLMAIEVPQKTLESYGLTLSDVARAIDSESFVETSGELKSDDRITKIKAARQGYQYRDFEKIELLSKDDGSRVHLGDVATILDTYEESPAVLSRFQSKPSIGLQIIATETGDVARIVEQTKEVIADWHSRHLLPWGTGISTWYDQSAYIKGRLSLLAKNALSGIALIFIILTLTLNMKVAFFVALGIPVSIGGALFLMGQSLLDISINELSTFGFILALGILVDDGVVIGESIYSRRKSKGDTLENTIEGVHKVAVPTIFGVLTTIAAFYPLSMVQGEMGQIFSKFSLIVVACFIFSLIESKLILPAHLANIDTRQKSPGNFITQIWQLCRRGMDSAIDTLKLKVYRRLLGHAIAHRYAVVLCFASLFLLVLSLVLSGSVRTVFFPEIPGSVIQAGFTLSEETGQGLAFDHALTIEQHSRTVNRKLMNRYELEYPVILNTQTLVTGATQGTVKVEVNKDRKLPMTINEIIKAWRDQIGTLEGVVSLKFSSGFTGEDDVRLELFSNDPVQLREAGRRLRSAVSRIPGVFNIKDNMNPAQPQIDLKLKPEGRAAGLTTQALATLVFHGFNGYEVQTFQRADKEVKVKVRFPPGERQSLEDLLATRIRLPNGHYALISQVAEVSPGYTVSTITRQNSMRSIYVSADVDKKILSPAGINARLRERVIPDILRDYPGLSLNFGGEAEEAATTTQSMIKLFAMTLLVIYILLAVPLGSYTQPLLIMTAIPFGLLGAVLGHLIAGIPLSLLSFLGMLALGGVMVNDSLLLVSEYNRLKGAGEKTGDAILAAGSSRLRAIMLTSVTTFAGLIPLLKETSEQAQFLIPAATSLGYGVMFGTLITLFLIPVLIHIREDWVKAGRLVLGLS